MFGFRFARPTRERRGGSRIARFSRSDTEHLYNTYTTGSTPRLTHNNVARRASGLACNTVKHETPVVASFSSHRAHATRRARDRAGSGIGIGDAAMRSASGPATSRAIRIFTRFSPELHVLHAVGQSPVGQTPEHQTPPRGAPASAWTGVTGTRAGGGGRRGARDTYRDTTGTSTAVLWLHLSLSTSRHSSALTYMVQAHNHHTTRTHGALSRHSTRTAHSTRTDITHMHTAQRRERGWEVSRRGAEGSRGRGPGLRPPLRRQVPAPPLDAPWHLDAPRRPDTRHLVS